MALTGTLFAAWKAGYEQGLAAQGIEEAQAARAAIPMAFHDVVLISIVINAVVVVVSFLPLWKRREKSSPLP